MAFNVVFYTFSKKLNSTARPSSGGTTYSCIIKEPSAILNPTIVINSSALLAAAPSYNYCYIAQFSRYYYVREASFINSMWEFSLEVDALASWKSQIGNTDLYVLRASAEWDGTIHDTFYPVKSDYQFTASNAAGASPWWDLTYGGTFIVGLLSYTQTGDVNGGINYIGFNAAMFDAFMRLVFNTQDGTAGANEGSVNAMRAVFTGLTETQARNLSYIAENPFTDYIDSITWVPGSVGFMSLQTGGLYLGPNLLACDYYSFDKKTMYRFSHTFSSIPRHPLAATRGVYLNAAPFTEYQLILPGYGKIPLDAAELLSYSSLTVSLDIDLITGQGLYRITAGSGNVIHDIAQFYCNVGVGIKFGENKPVGTALQNFAQMFNAVQNTSVVGMMRGIATLQHSRQAPGGSVKGTGGGYIGLSTRSGGTTGFPVLEAVHYAIADQDIADLGAPLLKVRKPSAIAGYIVAEHGDVSAPATAGELEEIKRAIESGFFYE